MENNGNEPFQDLRKVLARKHLRPSYHRLRVLEYLITHQNHPTVEQIYQDLRKDKLTVSKATVYNVLNAFVQADLIKIINIEDNELRYDIVKETHGHFKCKVCGEIFNFQVDVESVCVDELKGFNIDDKDVYFKGTCPGCVSYRNTQEKKEKKR